MLPRPKPRCFYDLVVEVAIVRPAPSRGGMVHPYLRARANPQAHASPYPDLRRCWSAPGRTHLPGAGDADRRGRGRVCAGEADALRRSMAAWKRHGNVSQYHDRLVGGMLERATRWTLPKPSSSKWKALANTVSPKATPPALPSWSTSAAGSRNTNRPFWRRCSTANPWVLQPLAAGAGCPSARRGSAAGGCVAQWVGLHAGTTGYPPGPAPGQRLRQAVAERIVAERARTPFASTEDLACAAP